MAELIPFRWPVEWKDASKLDLLKGTPINCVVGDAPPPFPLGDLKFIKLDAAKPPEGITIREGVWPRVLVSTKKDTAGGGPTGGPWVDSNAWVIRLAQTMEPGKTVWLTHTPPGGNEIIPLDSFVKAVAEAEAFGGHWIVTLDKNFIEGLDKGNAQALREWKRMMAAMKFFEPRREWRTWEPVAALAVVSTFEGEGKLMSEEFLNLAPRKNLAYRSLLVTDVVKASFAKQKAIIYVETAPPEGDVKKKLLDFAQAGGTLFAPPGTVPVEKAETRSDHTIQAYGKGRVIQPGEAWYDPFVLVDQIHVLMSHRLDTVRMWNASDMDFFQLASPKGDREVVHLVPYAAGKTEPVVMGLSKSYKSVRVQTLEAEKIAKPEKGALGIEIPVGEFTDYAAVLLEV